MNEKPKNVPMYSELLQKNPNLSEIGAAIIVQHNHWSGNSFAKEAPGFTPFKTHIFNPKTGKFEKNPLKELNDKGQLSDDSLAKAFAKLREGVPKGYKANRRTFERYISKLTMDDWDAFPMAEYAIR